MKPAIMRRVAFSRTRDARKCLGCGRILCETLTKQEDRLRCPECGTINQIKFTDHRTVVLTNEKYAEHFLHGSVPQIWKREEDDTDD